MKQVIDNDGNVIRKGMLVASGGVLWAVGYASDALTRLDRRTKGGLKQSRFVGKNRLCCVHVIRDFAPTPF